MMDQLNYVLTLNEDLNFKPISQKLNEPKKNILITIIIPVYNSEKTIKELVDRLMKVIGTKNLQIVLVNDGSQDNSHVVCLSLCSEYESIVTYIELAKNFGEHNAIMAGLHYARGDYIVTMDDDFQNPPEDVPHLVEEAIKNNYDIVYTYYKIKEHHWLRNAGSWFNDKIANILLNKPKDLYLSSFKCFSRFTANEILKYKGPYPYIDGLTLRSTRNIGKIQVTHEKRKNGHSGYTFLKLLQLWLNMSINFSIIPIRMSFLLGLILSMLGVIMAILAALEKIFNPHMPLGWSSLIICVITFSGVQLLTLGLLGEYIGRIFLSNNQTPQFVIREIH